MPRDRLHSIGERKSGLTAGADILLIFIIIFLLNNSGILQYDSSSPFPNPLWIPIVLSAIQYGVGPGLMSIVVATGLDWWMDGSETELATDYYGHLLNNLREPILWMLTVGVLGAIRQRQSEKTEELVQEAGQRHAQLDVLGEQCVVLRQEVARLEHVVAMSGAPNACTAVELLLKMTKAPYDRLEESFRQTVEQLIGAEGIELVLREDFRQQPYADRKISILHPPLTSLRTLCPLLVDVLLTARRPLSCRRQHDAERLIDAAMAAPVFGSAGEFFGVVLVRVVDPDCLSDAGEAALSLSCFILGKRISETRNGVVESEPCGVAPWVPPVQNGHAAGGEA